MKQKSKNILLVGGILLILVIAYLYSIKNTIVLRSQLAKLQQQETVYESAPSQLAALANKEQQLDAILKSNNIAGTSLQNNILKMLNETATMIQASTAKEAFKIVAFETPHEYSDTATGSTVVTYNFILEGTYQALIQTIYKLEQEYSFGNVIHLSFDKKKNYRTGKTSLECAVLLQRIK